MSDGGRPTWSLARALGLAGLVGWLVCGCGGGGVTVRSPGPGASVPAPPPTPRIAMDGTGRAIVVWNDENRLYARLFTPGIGWGPDEEVATSSQVPPAWAALPDPTSAMVAWQEGSQFVSVTRDEASGTWGTTPAPISNALDTVRDPRLVDTTWGTSGAMVAVWREVIRSFVDDMAVDHAAAFAARWLPGTGWQTPDRIDDDPSPGADVDSVFALDAAVDGFGRPTAIWNRELVSVDGPQQAIYAAWFDGSAWDAPVDVESTTSAGRTGEARVAADAVGNVLAVYVLGAAVRACRYDVQGSSWGTPSPISTAPGADSTPVVVSNGAGQGLALWTTVENMRLHASRYTPGSGWTPDMAIDVGIDGPVGASYWYAPGLDAAGNARVLWAQGRTLHTVTLDPAASSWSFAETVGIGDRPAFAMDASGWGVAAWWNEGLVTRTWEPTLTPSPDQGKIVFASYRSDSNFEVFSMSPDGTNVVRLTIDGAADTDPVWSPDKARYCFVSDRDVPSFSTIGSDLYIALPSPSATPTRLTYYGADGATAEDPAWSPDGEDIAFSLGGVGGVNGIGIVKVNTGALRQVSTAAGARWPAWSPDGQSIAFSLDGDLLLLDPAFNETQTPTVLLDRPEDDGQPAWSPDGTRIAFASSGGIGRLIVATGEVTQLTTVVDDSQPAWSSDGTRIAFVRSTGEGPRIFIMNAEGTGVAEVPDQVAGNNNPDWR